MLRSELRGNDVIVVSNREPYIHVRTPDGIRVQHPASGLVTALEPVMRACSGTWIAHGSGSADRETVDRARPRRRAARRIRATSSGASGSRRRRRRGYYGGFANEGLWPLCHIAHVRPTFRTRDFEHYRAVNAKFADAVVEEAKTRRSRRARAGLPLRAAAADDPRAPARTRRSSRSGTSRGRIPEAFAICPWRVELLDGLLGSSILGFHTQFHCNNFLDTVDRLLEARVDRESFTVVVPRRADRRAPLSDLDRVAAGAARAAQRASPTRASAVRERLEPAARPPARRRHRPPRLHEGHHRALQRGRAPARAASRDGSAASRSCRSRRRRAARSTTIATTRSACTRSPTRSTRAIADATYPPIILLAEHHEPDAVYEYLPRGRPLLRVSSLHDGMNLVAKEFVAARDDEQGVLILSQFAGASRELPEALDRQSLRRRPVRGGACSVALTMPADEQRDRMRFMRGVVREFNVYRWAGRMLLDAAVMRQRGRFRDRRRVDASWLTRRPASAERASPSARAPRRRPAAAARRDCALFLDIDGTLLELAPTPDGVRVDAGVAALLPRSRATLGGALALITGRSIADADRAVPGLRAADRRPARLRAARRRRRDAPARAATGDARPAARAAHRVRRAARRPAARGQGRDARAALPRSAPQLAAHVHRTLRAHAARRRARRRSGCSRARCMLEVRAGRPRQGHGDPRIHGGAAVRRAPCRCSSATTRPTSTASSRSTRRRRVGGQGRARRARTRATACPTSPPCATGSSALGRRRPRRHEEHGCRVISISR